MSSQNNKSVPKSSKSDEIENSISISKKEIATSKKQEVDALLKTIPTSRTRPFLSKKGDSEEDSSDSDEEEVVTKSTITKKSAKVEDSDDEVKVIPKKALSKSTPIKSTVNVKIVDDEVKVTKSKISKPPVKVDDSDDEVKVNKSKISKPPVKVDDSDDEVKVTKSKISKKPVKVDDSDDEVTTSKKSIKSKITKSPVKVDDSDDEVKVTKSKISKPPVKVDDSDDEVTTSKKSIKSKITKSPVKVDDSDDEVTTSKKSIKSKITKSPVKIDDSDNEVNVTPKKSSPNSTISSTKNKQIEVVLDEEEEDEEMVKPVISSKIQAILDRSKKNVEEEKKPRDEYKKKLLSIPSKNQSPEKKVNTPTKKSEDTPTKKSEDTPTKKSEDKVTKSVTSKKKYEQPTIKFDKPSSTDKKKILTKEEQEEQEYQEFLKFEKKNIENKTLQETHIVENKEEIQYVLVRIVSSHPVEKLLIFFERLAKVEGEDFTKGLKVVGSARVDHRRIRPLTQSDYQIDDWYQYTETNYTIMALHPGVVNLLKTSKYWSTRENQTGHDGMLIKPYSIGETNYPPADCEASLHCSFKDIKLIPKEESIRQIHLKMINMVEAGFVKLDEYKIEVYSSSMYQNNQKVYRNFAIIKFADNIGKFERASIKVCLDQTKFRGALDEETGKYLPFMCRISWVKSKAVNRLNFYPKPLVAKKESVTKNDEDEFKVVKNRK
jgi:hypothetical protein